MLIISKQTGVGAEFEEEFQGRAWPGGQARWAWPS